MGTCNSLNTFYRKYDAYDKCNNEQDIKNEIDIKLKAIYMDPYKPLRPFRDTASTGIESVKSSTFLKGNISEEQAASKSVMSPAQGVKTTYKAFKKLVFKNKELEQGLENAKTKWANFKA